MDQTHEKRNGERDDVGTLVRFAGKRRPVPEDRTERVRATVHAEWREAVNDRTRKRRTWVVGGLAAAAALVLVAVLGIALLDGRGMDGTSLRVESMAGAAWARQASTDGSAGPRALAVGAEVPPGTELTTSASGRMAVRLASGHSIRLDTATRVRFVNARSFALEQGAIYVDSGPDADKGDGLVVRTRFGDVREIGTQFEVRLEDNSLRIRLREGAVVLQDGGTEHGVAVGEELRIGPDGSPVTRSIPLHGAGWDWVAGITPTPDFEGRSAADFLGWVARERGWRLAFTDERLAREAQRIVLDGSLTRLTLDQSLEAVLPTCRMTHRVEGGILIVGPDSTP